MSDRPIAFDLTRLVTRLRHASPSGIDRVDLAYARTFLGGTRSGVGVVSTAFGPRILDRDQALAIVEAVAAGWVEDRGAPDDPVYRQLASRCGATPLAPAADAPAPRTGTGARRRIQARTAAGIALRGGPVAALPRDALYLHTSHLRLDDPRRFDWLYTRRDVRAAFFVHDLIPITHPEYGRAGEAERHRARLRTIGRHAAAILVNSADTGHRTLEHLAADGFGRPPVAVGHLGVEPAFGRAGPRFEPDRPTFLVCGTIESRKNHLLLFQIWRHLAERHGAATPRLIVVGRRGWEAESAIDMLERCPGVRAHTIEATGLSTHGLAALMRSCTALLMPSFTEGYGIPLVEAAASGLPVVASDIAVHREIAAGFALFRDPLDGPGWIEAIEALSRPAAPLRRDLAGRLDGYQPPTWATHFEAVGPILAAL
ncbi:MULTISPECIES: glycosyltransferase family 4 protein [unclassified Methylobacterium]|jgi:glycosyltransferase involved in cell wall biosynthesis|uniref:glycosyltransferase family 4 protein n=1 Tax=unclassified Methylobacterium TaxID=2615210 RepID=UPI00135350F4|nr:glycosyltransferase family 1 protein [Methylobacterium sp. 2A]MWV24040.1 glycosyltransferase family 4 protein [Methylobacterium sp. 2A]